MKPFKLGGSPFDQDTFLGRFQHFVDVTNPLTLLTSEKDILHAADVLQNYKRTGVIGDGVTNEDMWNYQKLVNSCVHPVTVCHFLLHVYTSIK